MLRRALSRVPVDLVGTGDYQPAERGHQLSRRMQEVCLELGFPVEGSYGAVRGNWREMALRLRELCEQHGIKDRMPRPIIPGDKRTLNKRVLEALAGQIYWMELQGESSQRVWAYRRAAWAIEDTPQDLGLIYRTMGRKGLESIENVGPRMAQVAERLLKGWMSG